jgi:hypothetical protein
MKYSDYLFESLHDNGTYSSLIPSTSCKEDLYSFLVKQNIPNLVDLDDYHCTLLYSRKSCPDIVNEDFSLPCEAIPVSYEVLGKEKKVLVLRLYCPNAVRLHNTFIEKYHGTHDYPEYVVHITIANEFSGDLPVDLPEFNIIFNGMTVEEIQ